MVSYKQVILLRMDLKLPRGKAHAQVAHASLEAALNSKNEVVDNWRKEGGKKIVLKVKNQKELFSYQKKAKAKGLVATVISDAGHTVLEPGTVTCVGIGPDEENKIDKITGKLKMV